MTLDDNDVEIDMDTNGQFDVNSTNYDILNLFNKTEPLITQQQQKTQAYIFQTNNKDSNNNSKSGFFL